MEEILTINYVVNGSTLTLEVPKRMKDLETLVKLVPKYKAETYAILNGFEDQVVLKGIK